MRKPALLAAGFLLAASLLLATVAWTCSPDFHVWLLGDDRFVLGGPTAPYSREVRKLAPEGTRFREPEASPWTATAEADRADLEKALAGTPPARRDEILARHAALRQTLSENASGARVPGGLPPEFADYLRGAIAYHERRFPEAAAIWERLLARPAAERRLRSTWAAFMLGKTYLRGDRAQAVEWFRKTRELAGQGFADSLGLAAASVGWEARAERDRGRLDRALALYVRQLADGDPTAEVSIRIVGRAALNAGPEALQAVARDDQARGAMTVFVLSPPGYSTPSENDPDAAAWLEAVKAAGIQEVRGADRLAWAAYLAGDFESAALWLDKTPPDAPIAGWLRAKLLLREGKLDEAAALLAETVRRLPSEPELALSSAPYATRERAMAEEGAVRLARGEHAPAFDLFLSSGFWLEAAYVAERVLTLDELRSRVDADWPAAKVEGYEPDDILRFGGIGSLDPRELAFHTRYLLGRRLAREGRLDEALPYLPASLRPAAKSLASDLAHGRDAARPRRERSDALFRAACLVRGSGLDLVATEVEPDWAYVAGGLNLGSVAEARRNNLRLGPAPDELARVERHQTVPAKRYHYRYQAADLAWEAAQLLPAGDRKAEVLATAGNWIQNRDPQAADRFYKQLVRCCRATELGRQADERRWFPEADTCPVTEPVP